jgi:hypothetical protein
MNAPDGNLATRKNLMRSCVYLQTALLFVLIAAGCEGGSSSVDSGRTSVDAGSASDAANSGGACPALSACGGTIAPGTFAVSSFCAKAGPVAYTPVCQDAMLSTVIADAQGSFTFSSDGTYSVSLTLASHMLLTVPASCMTRPGGAQSCSALGTALQEYFSGESSLTPTVDCTGSADCSCTIVGSAPADARGYWATQGDMLLLTPAGKTSQNAVPYCVSGNRLTLTPQLTGGGLGAQETMVLTRQ